MSPTLQGFPSSLSIQTPAWLSSRCQIKKRSIEDYYRLHGLLSESDEEHDPHEADRDAEVSARTSPPGDPLLSAPLTDLAGGTVYFGAGSRAQLPALLQMMDIQPDRRDFVAIGSQSKFPIHTRFLDQLWLLSSVTAKHTFGLEDSDLPGDQSMTFKEALLGFIDRQTDKWTEPGQLYSRYLDGAIGGDGEFAREALGFGFHVEDSYGDIYRIWSRPWVVLK